MIDFPRHESAPRVILWPSVSEFHVATADDEDGVDIGFFGVGDLAFDWIGAEIGFAADHAGAEFLDDLLGVVHQRFFVTDGQDADLSHSQTGPASFEEP